MAEQTRPTPEELWRQAGGGTPGYDRDRYRALLREHGHLIPLAPGETPQPLPCGWPTTPVAEQRCDVTELLVSQCAHCRKLPDPLADAQPEYGPAFEARYPGQCGECGLPIEPGEPIRAHKP